MANEIYNPDQSIPEYVRGYAENPRETFSCELKPWIDPGTNEHDQVKIAKACISLRNNNGGVLMIGISNEGRLTDLPEGYNPDDLFTQDRIHWIISRYSGELFEVDVHHIHFSEPARSRIVAIVVPGGIRTPVVCKRDSTQNLHPSVRCGVVYSRTLKSNGTVSSAPVSQQDLESITERCFDNRVADIGKFFRRHLTDENLRVMHSISEPDISSESSEEPDSELEAFADQSADVLQSYDAEDSDS